jgi:hypothetical protein
MKRLIFLFLTFLPFAAIRAEKHALIIAIGAYERSTGWNSLNSANDEPILRAALLSRGFADKNIRSYVDGALNRQAIMDAFRKDLIEKVKPGDVVFFHFSGHGQQILDDDGDEADGLDEALVPYDAPLNFYIKSPTTGRPVEYDGSLHLRDDDLGELLTELRTILGTKGNLMVSIDACHSGTATRGGITRGAAEPNVPKDWKGPSAGSVKEDYGFAENTKNTALAPMISFFGSSAHESNKEHSEDGKGMGSLSFSLGKVLTEANEKVSYRALFDMVKNQMASIVPYQTPQLEGAADQVIFGGALLPKTEYITVKEWVDAKGVKVNAGILQNLTVGSIVAFYPPDTRDAATVQPLAVGKVSEARYAESLVTLSEGTLDKANAKNAWCIVKERNVKESRVKLCIQAGNKTIRDVLSGHLKDYPFVEEVSDLKQAELLLEAGLASGRDKIRLTPVENYSVELHSDTLKGEKFSPTPDNLNVLTKKLQNFSQARLLRSLDVPHPELKAEVVILPLILKEGGDPKNIAHFSEGHPSQIMDAAGNYVIPEGTYVRFKLVNNSSYQVYYSILDIEPYNKVNVLFPTKSMAPSDCFVRGFTTAEHLATRFRIGKPYGNDILKIVITKKQLDLKSIYASEGIGGQRGAGTSVEKLFGRSFKSEVGSRSPQDDPLELEDLAIYSLTYTIVPLNP